MATTKTRRSASQQNRLASLKKAIRRYDLMCEDDDDVAPVGYATDIEEALSGERIDRWLVVIYSDEYEVTFGSLCRTRADAEAEASASAGDGYGKEIQALVDLDRCVTYSPTVTFGRHADKLTAP